jgi:hypothetical protein
MTTTPTEPAAEGQPLTRVTVTDVDMPFMSMVRFMVKWAIAAIPAIFILFAMSAVLAGVMTALLSTIRNSFNSTDTPPAHGASPSGVPATSTETKRDAAYVNKIEVSDRKVSRDELGGAAVFGEIKNVGDRTATSVVITIYCLDVGGSTVFEKAYSPVWSGSYDAEVSAPLKPGYSRKFGVRMADAPATWNKTVDVKVTSVDAAP